MILQRLATSIRKQDWFTVLIETMIVVFGVYLGIQLGNWNGARQDRAQFEDAFDRAMAETRRNLQDLEDTRAMVEARLPIVKAAIEDLRACRTDEAADARVQAAFAPAGYGISFNLDTTSLDQLINNPDFLPFQPPETRSRLMEVSRQIGELAERSRRQVEASIAADSGGAQAELIYTRGPETLGGVDEIIEAIKGGAVPSQELVRPTILRMPLSEACKDDRVLNHFYGWEGQATYHAVMAGLATETLRADLAALGHPVEEALE